MPVSDPAAQRLLTEYFRGREETFPSAQGTYRTPFPAPEQFVPPAGQFLLVLDGDGPVAPDTAVGCGGIRRIADAEAGETRFEVKHLFCVPSCAAAVQGNCC